MDKLKQDGDVDDHTRDIHHAVNEPSSQLDDDATVVTVNTHHDTQPLSSSSNNGPVMNAIPDDTAVTASEPPLQDNTALASNKQKQSEGSAVVSTMEATAPPSSAVTDVGHQVEQGTIPGPTQPSIHDDTHQVSHTAATADSIDHGNALPREGTSEVSLPGQDTNIVIEGHPEEHPDDTVTTSSGQEWPLKLIHWPPFTEYPRQVKILMQDLNGPCSFLALCNVLLLRGDINLPLDQKSATFTQLSSLVADYLLRTSTSASPSDYPTTSNDENTQTSPILPQESLDFALNTLPKTLSGLDVNVNFITGGFSDSTSSAPTPGNPAFEHKGGSELDLFKLAKVDFRHGWLASEDDRETYEVLLSVANDYDTAVNLLVEGDAIAEGHITGNGGGPSSSSTIKVTDSSPLTADTPAGSMDAADDTVESSEAEPASPKTTTTMTNADKLERLFEDLSMEPNKQAKVYQATLIQRFLNQTSTQLTYAGLFNLSESLPQGSLCALFRNSHFSVLYRRPDVVPLPEQAQDATQPTAGGNGDIRNNATNKRRLPQATLFQLVTDQALLHEPNAVWESLEDVDGSASAFYDSYLRPARIRQDWVSRSERDPVQTEQNNATHDADMALAAQLQQDEYDAEDQAQARHRQRSAQNTNNRQSDPFVQNHSEAPSSSTTRGGTSNPSAHAQEQAGARRESTRAGTVPEHSDSQPLIGLAGKISKKQKESKSTDKKGKKDCIIC